MTDDYGLWRLVVAVLAVIVLPGIGWVVALSNRAGRVENTVEGNTKDIDRIDDERKACRLQMDERVATTMDRVGSRLGEVETKVTAVSTKLDTLIELNGGRKK